MVNHVTFVRIVFPALALLVQKVVLDFLGPHRGQSTTAGSSVTFGEAALWFVVL